MIKKVEQIVIHHVLIMVDGIELRSKLLMYGAIAAKN